jgi:urease accessory protein
MSIIMSITEAALYRLMTWLSPAYPLGAFSYSHGLEYAVEAGLVTDRDSLQRWVSTAIGSGAGRSDAALLVAAWRAVRADDRAALDVVVALAAAWRGTAETALESRAQGAAFLATTRTAWPHPLLDELALQHRGELALPVAVGVAAAAQDVPLAATLAAYLHAFGSNLVSAGVRLLPLGQTDGQLAIAALEHIVAATAAPVMAMPLEEIGTAAPLLDWCSMRHETQYTRLFRS